MPEPASEGASPAAGRAPGEHFEGGHRYLPIGGQDRDEMLSTLGVETVENLFDSLPPEIRRDQPLKVDGPLSDQELRARFGRLAAANRVPGGAEDSLVSFLGAGAYRHESPSLMDHVLTRSEFLTVYTPYQPEVSQGTLQCIFEFQTFISLLTGLSVANASLYEGGSAFAEAVLMADRIQRKRKKVIVARSVHPDYRATLATYATHLDLEIVEVGWDAEGRLDLEALEAELDEDTASVAVQSPNYFGVVEPWERVAGPARGKGALTIGVVTEALSLALLASPGEGGCDIACGEAQSFGLPLSFGGPYLGFLSARDEFKRQMPGRLAGQTVDVDGNRAYVLTLATREQHIRREKATSNICTNQALCALAATVYLGLHGKHGLRRLAEINLQRAASLRRRLEDVGLEAVFPGPAFNERAYRFSGGSQDGGGSAAVAGLLKDLEGRSIAAGLPLACHYPELENAFILAVTECNPPEDLDRLVSALQDRGTAGGE